MPEFKPPSYGPMDREYHERIEFEGVKDKSDIEAPIFPVGEIGQTIPETDPSGRFKTFIQQAQAAIRAGAGNLQLAMNVPHTSAMGGRFKAYGKEVREALREVALASEVQISGVELPTSSLTNMSGYDPQRNRFSDEVRKDHLDEVKDAIKFVAEACGGGGVDIVSWEYERPINDAPWNKEDEKLKKQLFRQPGEMEIVQVVDTRTGSVTALRKGETWHLPFEIPANKEDVVYDTKEGIWRIKKEVEMRGGLPQVKQWDWKNFVDAAKLMNAAAEEHNKMPGTKEEDKWQEVKPETLLLQSQLEGQRRTALGYAKHYGNQAQQAFELAQDRARKIERAKEELERLQKDPETNKTLILKRENNIRDYEKEKTHYSATYESDRALSEGQLQQVKEIEERQKRFTAVSDYAENKAVESYAEAGIAAMQETHNKNTFAKNPIHVGPEIGWPQFFGSHPEEFVGMIRNARKEMVFRLTEPKRKNWEGQYVDANGNVVHDYLDETTKKVITAQEQAANNDFYQTGLSRKDAEEQARTHIKGVFDTSHMGMWLRNFRPELPWDKRVEEFNNWFKKKMEWMADINKKEQIIGAIQAVDSATGAHAHLPPGQGILPVKEAVDILKQKGDFRGFLVSEGHEEEKFGEGRMLLKTWEKFGAHLENSGYRPGGGVPLTWNAVQNAYFGKTYSPMFMFGSYAPSNEFKLWSEIPFE